MIRAIGFDLHGVIIANTEPVFLVHLADDLGVNYDYLVMAMHEHGPSFERGEVTLTEFWRRLGRSLKISLDPRKAPGIWSQHYTSDHPVNQRVLKLVDQLRRRDYKVGLLSNTNAPHVAVNTARGIFAHFDVTLMSNQIGALKPEPRAYQLLIDAFMVPAGQLAYVDDKPVNLIAARKLGIHTLEYTSYPKLVQDLRVLGVNV